MKRILLFLLAVLLLVSCASRKTETLAIASSVGAEIYTYNRKEASVILLDEDVMRVLIGENGRDIRGIMDEIFKGKVYYVADNVYEERRALYNTLLVETQAPSILALWEKDGKRLKDTKFVSYLDGLTYGFDGELSEMIEKGSAHLSVYHASDVVEGNCNYEKAIIFLKRWIKAIIG